MSYYGNDQDGPNWGRIIWGVCIVVGVVFAIVVAGWQLGFFFKEQGTNKTDQIYRQSYGYQQGLRGNVSKNIQLVLDETTQIDNTPLDGQPNLKAQRLNTVGLICADAAQITDPLDPGQQTFVQDNCVSGAISPASSYNH